MKEKMHKGHHNSKMTHQSKDGHHSMKNVTGKKESMAHKGYAQGDMEPHVVDFQKPGKDFSQEGFNKTTEYVERQDAFQAREAKDVEKQAYYGRYS